MFTPTGDGVWACAGIHVRSRTTAGMVRFIHQRRRPGRRGRTVPSTHARIRASRPYACSPSATASVRASSSAVRGRQPHRLRSSSYGVSGALPAR